MAAQSDTPPALNYDNNNSNNNKSFQMESRGNGSSTAKNCGKETAGDSQMASRGHRIAPDSPKLSSSSIEGSPNQIELEGGSTKEEQRAEQSTTRPAGDKSSIGDGSAPISPTDKSNPRRGQQLSAVKSLEVANGRENVTNHSQQKDNRKKQQTLPAIPSTSGSQQKQMFSLKQLAINSRNLAKKRGQHAQQMQSKLETGRGNAFSKLFDINSNTQNQDSSSSSNSSRNNSCAFEAESTRTQRIALSNSRRDDGNNNNNISSNSSSSSSKSDDEFDDDDSDEYDDNEEDGDDEEDDEAEGADKEEADGKENAPIRGNESGLADLNTNKKQQRRQRTNKRRIQLSIRRPSCCNCEPLISKIDFDGLPVTDIDLVTYKDLCQMEQQAHHMRTNNRRHHLDAQSLHSHNLQVSNLRRSSLQEESGAYYQLCTSGEEQAIRQKYIWFPPSLKQLSLVDQFFANFPDDKIPFALSVAPSIAISSASSTTISGSTNKQQTATSLPGDNSSSPPTAESEQQAKTTTATNSSHPATASLASSYRDEQISFQLPRQDISLDYCSYPLNEASRAAYLQFIEKRNGHALDVGTVVQMTLNFGQITTTATSSTQQHSQGSRTPTANSRRQLQQQSPSRADCFRRKASTVSQLAVAANQSQHEQIGQHTSGNGAQRCRRCLVRFEDKQLAVVAPNFVIGSTLYRPSIISAVKSVGRRGSSIQTAVADGKFAFRRKESAGSSSTGDTSISALQPPTNVAHFHPNCFTCSTCKEFLVDLVYCLRDNKLYCLRHYGESLRPRCSWCQELIFSDEYLKAMNESFHVDHFLCRHCDSNLAGQRYVLKDEKPFCIQCYEGNFANICEDCQKPIGIDSRDLSYKERHWHDTCFVCNKCQESLIDKPFGSKSDKVYCADCYDVTFATRCDGCKNPFRAGSKKMEYRGRQWHDSCFCCCICQNTIGSNSFIPKNDEIYCIKCYEDKYATRCTKCKQVIVSGGVTFRNEPWHRDCFNCCNCNKSLAGQRFTTRDVTNETVKNTNKTNQPHNAYCIDCYGELFAKKCYACSQAITGLGGTRFVTFEDRSWHNDCFLCNDCNTSLVGKGFITDGPESILCGDCARAKLR